MAPAVVEPPLLPWLRLRRPHQRRLPLPPAPPPHCALVVALQLALEERAPAASTLERIKLLAPHAVQEDPLPLPHRLARALPASCLTLARCARALVGRDFRWSLLPSLLGLEVQEPLGGESQGLDTRPAQRCACPN